MQTPHPGSSFPGRPNGVPARAPARPAAPPPPEDPDTISLHEVLDLLVKGRWVVLATFAAVMLATTVYTLTRPKEYEASSTVLVSTRSTPQLGEMLGLPVDNRNIQNEIEIIKSRTLGYRIVDRIRSLERVPGTDAPFTVLAYDEGTPPPDSTAVMNRLRKDYMKVQPVSPEVDLIKITAVSTFPQEAQWIADAYAGEYVAYNRRQSRQQVTASRRFLGDQVERFEAALTATEGELQSFLHSMRVIDPSAEAAQLFARLGELEALRTRAQLERAAAAGELAALERERSRLLPGLEERLAANEDLVIEQLRTRLAELTVRERAMVGRNPALADDPGANAEFADLRRDQRALQDELRRRSVRVVENLAAGAGWGGGAATSNLQAQLGPLQAFEERIVEEEIRLIGAEANLEVLDGQLVRLQEELGAIPSKQLVLDGLQRTRKSQEEIYLELVKGMNEARMAEQSELGYAELLDPAIVPDRPVRPRTLLNLVVGGLLGVLLGLGLAIARSALDNRVRRPDDLRKRGYTVLGAIPDMTPVVKTDFDGQAKVAVEGRRLSTTLLSLLNPMSPVAEAYRRVRTNIQYSRPDAYTQVVMVTSCQPGDGKTTTAANLAVAFAQSGRRTLLVDADLRRPMVHDALDLPKEPGLTDRLFSGLPPTATAMANPLPDLYVLTAGSGVPNPAEVVGSKKMRDFIAAMRDDFDVILVDTPPVLAVTDPLLVVGQTDAVVLVATAGETAWTALDHTVEHLHRVGASITGVVLNRHHAGNADYGYGYGYAYEGTYDKAPAPAPAPA